ncbi:MAG: hypothetical protein KBD48_03510 [Candidatus Pacebacteria bacterium]|nr:hypothetical protein [Candidatus Paceibacterota bacterium]
MKDYIYKLRSKPEEIRKQYMFFFIAIFMTIVGGVWVYSLTNTFFKSSASPEVGLSEDVKPFALFASSIKDTYKNVKASAVDPFTKDKEEIKDVIPVENQKMITLTVIDNQ